MKIEIGNRKIGDDEDVFIIGELSSNHQQNFDIAAKTIEATAKSGADAIKLQTYTPDTMTLNCDNNYFQIEQGTPWDGKTLYQLYNESYTPWEWHPHLKEIAEDLGLMFFSTPFDKSSVDFLEKMNVPLYKIASFEVTDLPFIKYVASKGKPILISTGISKLCDIELAIKTCYKEDNKKIALLKCTSQYPSPAEEMNLNSMISLKKIFGTVIGLSDHSLGVNIPIASVALGAKIVEKHITLDRDLGGPDSKFSLNPSEFKEMTKSIREIEKAMGKEEYQYNSFIEKNRMFRRSIFVCKDVIKGEIFTTENIKSIRPGYGIHPKYFTEILGKKAKNDIKKGIPLSWEMIE